MSRELWPEGGVTGAWDLLAAAFEPWGDDSGGFVFQVAAPEATLDGHHCFTLTLGENAIRRPGP